MSLEASGISSSVAKAIQDITDDVMNPFDLRSAWVTTLGAAGMPDGDDDDDGDDTDDGEGDEDGEDDAGSSGASGTDDIKDPEAKKKADKEAQYRIRAKNAETKLAELEAWKKEQEDKDKSEVEKLSTDLQTVTSERDQLRDENKTLRIQNAFSLKHSSKFRDPEAALQLLGSKFEIDDDGEVEGLDDAVEDLLKRKSYLAASKGDATDDDDELPESGRPLNGKRKNKGDANLESLQKKYPALRR